MGYVVRTHPYCDLLLKAVQLLVSQGPEIELLAGDRHPEGGVVESERLVDVLVAHPVLIVDHVFSVVFDAPQLHSQALFDFDQHVEEVQKRSDSGYHQQSKEDGEEDRSDFVGLAEEGRLGACLKLFGRGGSKGVDLAVVGADLPHTSTALY